MKYKIELKKTKRMGHAYENIYLMWIKNGISHVTTSFEEATEFEEKDLKQIEKKFGNRVVLYKKRKGSKEWKK